MKFTKVLTVAAMVAGLFSAQANADWSGEVPVSGHISTNTTWSAGNNYILSGYCIVDSGVTLTIQPGAVVRGLPGFKENAAALFVARHGKINATGTATNPIIFTSYYDDLDDVCDFGPGANGLWGGLVLLGNAPISTLGGQKQIEGAEDPALYPWSWYGGSNVADSSGVLKYVSLRHGGVLIATAKEINGLTLGGVGNKTVIENIEVYASMDDGYEWFGGTVNCKYLISAFVGDDAFDYDDGYKGKGQFWFSIHRYQIGYSGSANPGMSSGEPVSESPAI